MTDRQRRLLLALSDRELRQQAERALHAGGHTVSAPSDPSAAAMLVGSFHPDVVVADDEFATAIRAASHPETDHYLIRVESTGTERRRIELLRAGADDAVSVPVSAEELAARCETVIRRAPQLSFPPSAQHTDPIVQIGPLVIDTGRYEVRYHDQVVPLTKTEFRLLHELASNPSGVVSRSTLLQEVWGIAETEAGHVVDVHMSNLRRKLASVNDDIEAISTVRGIGFQVSAELLAKSRNGLYA